MFDQPAVVDRVVDDLHSRGWVADSDSLLRLTPDGARAQETLAPLADRVRHQVAGVLPDEEYATVVRLLARLVAAFPAPTH